MALKPRRPAFIKEPRAVVGCLFPPGQGIPLKAFLIISLLCVSGCSWFHRKPHAPDPTELVVVGAPVGSTVFVDGVQSGQAKEVAKQPQEVDVAPGTHVVEVRVGETVAYRENTYVTQGEKHVISVLSGRN
jgi:PEGA domain